MPRNLLWRLPLAASVFVTLGGLLVSCGPPDGGVKFDIPLLLSGPNLIKDGNFESSEQMPFKDSPGEPINPVQGATGSQAKALCGGSNSLLPNWSVSRVSAPRQDCSLPGTGGAADSVFWVNTP